MTQPDRLLLPRWLVPVVPAGAVLEDHALALAGDRILDVLPRETALAQWPEVSREELPDHVLMPGLVNMHTHSAMTLLRGFADDLALDTWLNDHIWPAEGRWVSREFVRDGTQLALLEMLRGGTTCFNDNYFFPDVTAAATHQAGLRATVGIPVLDIATAWAGNSDEYFSRGLAVHQEWRGDEQIRVAFAPHAPYSVSDEQLQRIQVLADELDALVHIHCLETAWDIEHSMRHYGIKPLARLQRHGLLNPRLLTVHMTQLDDSDRSLLAREGVHVIHCPESNLKLASGMCEVDLLVQAGVNVSIGTDGAASNNDLDLLGEAHTAALLAKGVSGRPEALDAATALAMITINGARALGLEDEIGSLEAGKSADLCAVDLSGAATQPVHHVISQVIYACGAGQVTDVWVRGERLLKGNQPLRLDEEEILARAAQWGRRIGTPEQDSSQQKGGEAAG